MKKSDIKKNYKKILSYAVKILIAIIIGFLPSFIFVAFFVQYGSPFSNYINFLSNIKSSWLAWIFAMIIAPLIYFIFKRIRSPKKIKKIIKNKRSLIILILSLLAVLVLISVQLYLYTNFVLGNDILVRLSSDKDHIFFTNSTSDEVTFKISIVMNPFCTAQCNYEFFDLSNGEFIDKGSFNTTSIFSKTRDYTLNKSNRLGQVLNRFEVSCKSKKTILCYTKETESKRAVLITLNNEITDEDKEFKEESKMNIFSLWQILYSVNDRLNESQVNLNSINNSFSTESFSNKLNESSNLFIGLNQSFINLKELWEAQNLVSLRKQLPAFEDEIKNLSAESGNLSLSIKLDMHIYNNLTDSITTSAAILQEVSQISLTDSLCNEFNNLTTEFNEAINKFENESYLPSKSLIVESISSKINEFYDKVQNITTESVSECSLDEAINNDTLEKINIVSFDNPIPEITLNELPATCCFFGDCEKCCDETCSNENYPIIFLHGHSINKALPTDYSFDSFEGIKDKLTNENYIDAGAIVISSIEEEGGLWGKLNVPIMVTASYFFDVYKKGNKETTVSSNVDSIDTYAIRLKDIVDLVKYRTNKDKVILVAQSGGGLVTRRYIQVFGGANVDKVILITVPNHGVDDKVRDYCALFGPEAACNDMNKDSIFINKLNNAPTDIVPTYNFVGIGCNMGDETGDGIIKNSSQYLDYATNYYIKGKCDELNFDFLHEKIIYPDQYPELYNTLKAII